MARLRAIRRCKLLTQPELAERAGVSAATIRAVEGRYGRSPRLRTMRQITQALGVAVEDIDEFRAVLEADYSDAPGADCAPPHPWSHT